MSTSETAPANASALIPARRVLVDAESANRRLGHENLGFLSETHGFLPVERPRLALPRSHQVWDETAADLPEMFRTLTLRTRLDRLPILSAAEEALPEGDLYRAAAILGILAHAYHYVEAAPYPGLPDSVVRPWAEVSRRLQRPAPHLSFIDLNIYNWRLINPHAADPMRMENLSLLIPIVGNEDERRFQCTPIEIIARFTPVLGAVVRAQEAVQADAAEALKRELILIADAFQALTHTTFMKVNPNAYHPLYVDPVVWGKTVAPIATPFQDNKAIPGPSGTAIPTFTLMDIFFGRTGFASVVGHETDRTRAWFPPHWQAFLSAAEQISVPDYVQRSGDEELAGLFQQAMEAYSGENGLLGRHRLKAYGFLDLSFKAGRSRTLGGFDGGFEDRLWDRMDDELEIARQERYSRYPESCHFVRLKRVEDLTSASATPVRRVVLDTRGTGLRYQPGDRCAILPENTAELVERTLAALRASGDEPISLTAPWRAAVQLRDGYQAAQVLSLRTLLTFGRIRPVSRAAAKTLQALTHNETLHRIVEARAEDQWELWDVLNLLATHGFNPKRLWKAAPGEREHIAQLVPPETFRMYSISSVMAPAGMGVEAPGQAVDEIHLTIGGLNYLTSDTALSHAEARAGTASAFLSRLTEAPTAQRRISIKVVHPPRFSLPADPTRPVVMLAGGTGIAPFRGLLHARAAQPGGGENWLFYGARTRADLYYLDEWEALAAAHKLQLRVAFSQEATRLQFDGRQFVFEAGPRRRLGDEILDPENAQRLWELVQAGAYFYVCGRTGFAKTVREGLLAVLAQNGKAPHEHFNRLVGEDRYLQEIFTTYPGPQFDQHQLYPASEIVLHNNPQDGYWMVINGRVYDVSAFAHQHPGGLKIIQSYAGMDATVAYRRAQHDVNPEVDSLTGMFEIGAVRRLNFGPVWGLAVSPKGLRFISLEDLYGAWIRFLYAVVEMENALLNDYSLRAEQVTYDERRGAPRPSPYRTQLLLQTHERFLRDYVSKSTGATLDHLWAITGGLCSEHHDYRWARQQVDQLEASPAARLARALGPRLLEKLSASASRPVDVQALLTQLEPRLADLAEIDLRFLSDLKHALRRGVQVFELHERHTLTHSRQLLLEIVQSLPQALGDYYERVARLIADQAGALE